MPTTSALWRIAPAAALAILIGPITMGLIWTILPAFHVLPALGATRPSLDGWRMLAATPGFATSLRLTIATGTATTLLALAVAVGFCASAAASARLRRLERALPSLLASPHSAMALGFAFLVIPSGWIARLISPWATGWHRPPANFVTVQDPLGVGMIVGLLIKEVPYLILMIIAAAAQVPVHRTLIAARALGQPPAVAWLKTVFPQIYPQIRLPIFAVLAFSLSVVDVGLILAPGDPPPLAILATRWFSGYDLALYYPAAAVATLQLAIVLGAIICWRVLESPVATFGRLWLERGETDRPAELLLKALSAVAVLLGTLGGLSMAGMALWSVARSWWFPAPWPQAWQATNWVEQSDRIAVTTGTTLAIGFLSTFVALGLVLACLENEQRRAVRPGVASLWLLYLPLLVPQIAFLFGVQIALVYLGVDGTLPAVAWTHLLFVLPYTFLSLADPYRALDPRYAATAAALGASPLRIFFAVRLPLLARPILVSIAVGFAVSAGLYLPTIFAGAGRVATLTTEAVTLAGGADRRIIGVFAVLQSALPLMVYIVALLLPRIIFYRRRELAR
ncbi:MAG: ABC transporter permease [Geminicoccaceae bacterium]